MPKHPGSSQLEVTGRFAARQWLGCLFDASVCSSHRGWTTSLLVPQQQSRVHVTGVDVSQVPAEAGTVVQVIPSNTCKFLLMIRAQSVPVHRIDSYPAEKFPQPAWADRGNSLRAGLKPARASALRLGRSVPLARPLCGPGVQPARRHVDWRAQRSSGVAGPALVLWPGRLYVQE